MTANRIVLVDDDELFRESLEQNLTDAGFDIVAFGDGPAALEYFASGEPASLVLLDWKMPVMNGIEVLRRLRNEHFDVPVIFLTVLSDQIFEEAALHGGAVDFIEKSRSFAILMKRIELILGGSKEGPTAEVPGKVKAEVHRGDLTLMQVSKRALWKGRELDLTLTEFKIVALLAERAGEDIGYREIYDLVHGKNFIAGDGEQGYRANVRAFIKRIRHKFRAVDPEFDKISNYPGFGYSWETAAAA